MTIDARGMHFQPLNEAVRSAGSSPVVIEQCVGQRYIGSGLSEKTIEINGTPGNALGAYLDGAEIVVHGNAQDATGDTMNEGTICIHGSSGDATGYAMRGGSIWVRGSIGYRGGIHMKEYREKLEERVRELLGDTQMEEARIASEVVLYADKICTDEETVRLRSHIESMQRELQEGCSIGRKLDFIAQEMNREANTILSKANDLETSNIAINLKTEIEKVREQIQNIE